MQIKKTRCLRSTTEWRKTTGVTGARKVPNISQFKFSDTLTEWRRLYW